MTKKMRVLMLSTPFPTHFTPMVPLAWALMGAGHEVKVAAQPDVTDAARAAGVSATEIGDRFHGLDVLQRHLPEGVRPLELMGPTPPEKMAGTTKLWETHARYLLSSYLEFAQDWRPDLIVSEQMELTGQIVAAVLGIPSVQHRWGVDPLSGPSRASARNFLYGTAERLGLAGLPDPDLVLDPCPPALRHPSAAPGAPIGYVPFNGAGTVPEWLQKPAAEGIRRVVVCLGRQTLVLNGTPLFRSIIAAFDGLTDVEAVVTADPAFHEGFGQLPENVRVVEPVPLNLFLRDCDAVIHHGGANTTMTSCVFGLPQVVLPQIVDQFASAELLASAGAGRVLGEAAPQNDPGQVREAVRDVLDDPRYLKCAQELGADMAGMPSPARVVEDLERLAG
ncbi:nucleotide disphospho-sugar-binding domain-containing protein [Streptomyces sp. NPDC091267]|uniref:nucleotide disphospho-sugar-binding domain-containing protein n=1 Tax=Streptomyces sp. NPDC091267 TaxID=3155195 RepID=UPI003434D4B3